MLHWREILKAQGPNSKLAVMLGHGIGMKENISPMLYLVAIGMAFVNQWISDALYVLVAGIWLVPDRRIEKNISG